MLYTSWILFLCKANKVGNLSLHQQQYIYTYIWVNKSMKSYISIDVFLNRNRSFVIGRTIFVWSWNHFKTSWTNWLVTSHSKNICSMVSISSWQKLHSLVSFNLHFYNLEVSNKSLFAPSVQLNNLYAFIFERKTDGLPYLLTSWMPYTNTKIYFKKSTFKNRKT